MKEETRRYVQLGLPLWLINRAIWLFVACCFRVFFLLRVDRESALPTSGGVLVVANHCSHLDPPLLGTSLFRRVHFLARGTLATSTFMKLIFRIFGVVPVARDGQDREAFTAAVELLKAGYLVVIFPEGTRSHDGRLGDFKKGGELLARRAKVPILPMGLVGTYRCWSRHRSWPRPGRLRIRVGRLIPPEEVGGVDLRAEVARLVGER